MTEFYRVKPVGIREDRWLIGFDVQTGLPGWNLSREVSRHYTKDVAELAATTARLMTTGTVVVEPLTTTE